MSQKSTKSFINEIYSKPRKKNYATNKTDIVFFVLTTFGVLDLKVYGTENNGEYIYVLVIIDNFSKFERPTPLKNQKCSNKKISFKNIIKISKRKPNSIEADRGKKIFNHFFQKFLKNNKIKHFPRNRYLGLFLQKDLIELLEIFSRNLFVKRVIVNGLIYYNQKRNSIKIE